MPACAELPSGSAGPPAAGFDFRTLPGLEDLWAETLGDPRVRVAVLDGPVDRRHPSLRHADLTVLELLAPAGPDDGPATRHGTQIASILFGQPGGPVTGLAPRCQGLVAPVFDSGRPCSQLDLARALAEAVRHGAHVLNFSGGEFSAGGAASPLLAETVRRCLDQDVLLVAAAGNPGHDPHLPAALPGVLAVGALAADGTPLTPADLYAGHGLLAPGENILGGVPGGGAAPGTGTSYAAAVVSGVAALLLSLLWKRGKKPSPGLVREALLRTAIRGDQRPTSDCRLRSGRLDVRAAVSFLLHEDRTMSQLPETAPSPALSPSPAAPTPAAGAAPSSGQAPGGCGCGCPGAAAAPRLVYALGRIGYDLISEARLDSLTQQIAAHAGLPPDRGLAFDPRRAAVYLDANPWDAPSVEWTLVADGTPVYALRPQGPFAGETYQRLREFLRQQLDEGVERASVAGTLAGKATLLMGQVVPVLVPELRGLYSWTTAALVRAVIGPPPGQGATAQDQAEYERKRIGVTNFLERVYHELRNLGVLPQERAVNFAATNAFQVGEVYAAAMRQDLELDTVKAAPSPICRPGSDCWDVEVYFFDPQRQVQTVRRVYRFTVDVSDVVPVTIGPVRSWYTR